MARDNQGRHFKGLSFFHGVEDVKREMVPEASKGIRIAVSLQ